MHGIGLSKGLGVGPRRALAIDPADVTLGLFGDSMIDQQTDPGVFENLGFMNALNLITAQRFIFDNSLNFGVSGEKTGDALLRVGTVAASAADEIIILLGANDRRLKYSAQYSIDNFTAIIAALRSAGKKMTFVTHFLGRDSMYVSNGLTSGEIAQAKIDVVTVNDFLKAQAAADLRIADAYSVMTDTDGQGIAAYLKSDLLHPNATGGWVIMEVIYPGMVARYGVRNFALSANNKFTNTNFSGTGTPPASRENGQIASNHITAGSAPTGPSSVRTYSKSAGQIMAFDFPSGGSTRDNMRLSQRAAGDYSTKKAYYEVELRVNNIGAGSGIWHAMSAEVLSSAGSLAIGYDRGASTEKVPVDLIKAFCDKHHRTLLLRTPVATIPASTYVEGRFNLECDSTAGARSGAVELLNEQLVII